MNYKVSKKDLKDKLDSFQSVFREHGFKITPQREEIYRKILETSSHPSVDKIFEQVKLKFPNISIDTVYRNVESLEKVNLINRISDLEGKNHFEVNNGQHHHFICSQCHTIYDFNFPKAGMKKIDLPQDILKIGNVESTHLLVKGICKKCISSK